MSKNITRLPFRPTSRRKVRVFKGDDCTLDEVVRKEPTQPVSNSIGVSLIPVGRNVIGDAEVNSVDARNLHVYLGSKQQFGNWIKNRISQYNFTEGIDFISYNRSIKAENTYINTLEYTISLDMAKELSMVERTVKGKEARQYFIECERVKKELEANPITITLPSLGIHSECTNSLITLCTEASKIAGMCVAAVEEKGRVIIERDAALHDRQHTNTQVASAMNTVGVLSKMVKDLEAELGLINS